MSIPLHPRYFKVAEAGCEIKMAVLKLEEKYDLTLGEMMKIILEMASDFNRYAIRAERHPNDPDKKGDEA